jgi:hypothetical protein
MFQIVLIYFILREVACLFYYDVDKDALNVKHRVLRAGRNDKGQNNAIVEIATSKNMVDKLALLRLGCKAIAYDVPALIFMIYLCTQYEYDSVGFSML